MGPASAVHTRLVNARIVLVVDESSPVARLVDALASLEYPSLPQHALIGGLAVMCRLATAHRPTADVDTLARDDAIPTVAEVLVARGATRTSTGVELAGVKIDILEVGDLPPPAALPEDDLARAFVLAHSWALATAEPARIDARSPEGRTFASAQLEVATPAALVAMKLHAINQRRASTQIKRSSERHSRLGADHTPGNALTASDLERSTGAYGSHGGLPLRAGALRAGE